MKVWKRFVAYSDPTGFSGLMSTSGMRRFLDFLGAGGIRTPLLFEHMTGLCFQLFY